MVTLIGLSWVGWFYPASRLGFRGVSKEVHCEADEPSKFTTLAEHTSKAYHSSVAVHRQCLLRQNLSIFWDKTMRPPTTLQELINCILRSGLLSPDQLRCLHEDATPRFVDQPQAAVEYLVQSGLLTPYQAGKILRGVTAGLSFGPFRIRTLIGRGSVGQVYEALDTRTNLICALKVLPPSRSATDSNVQRRFRREMLLASIPAHPHVATAREIGRQDGIDYLVMNRLEGCDLETRVVRQGPLSMEQLMLLLRGASAGLAHLHANRIIHRDVAPTNLVVADIGHTTVIDLGLALRFEEAEATAPPSGQTVGTAGYIAPEQIRNALAVSDRSDVYALACCLFLAATGQEPFPGDEPERFQKQLEHPKPDLAVIPQPIFRQLLSRMFSPEPQHRPSAQELLEFQATD